MRKTLSICVALLFSSLTAHAQSAADILAKVNSVYASCRTYADEGSTSIEGFGAPGQRAHFRTSFMRPAAFRFELWSAYSDSVTPWGVVKNGEVTKIFGFPVIAGIQDPHFDSALGRLSAVSAGGSLTIPPLLLPEAFRMSQLLSSIVDAKLTGEEKIDGQAAFRLEGTVWKMPIKLWIDKSQFLILKVHRRIAVGPAQQEITIQYKPRINVSIPPEQLTFPQSLDQAVAETEVLKLRSAAPSRPLLAPRRRDFGSSLSDKPETGRVVKNSVADDDVVRVDTDLVVSSVLVLDSEGKIVRGLSAPDFALKEDGKSQEVATLSLGDNKDVPRSIVLIIDYSGSQLPYIKTSIESAKMLVAKLNPKDRMAIVTDDVNLLADFTSDKELLKSQLERLKTSALAGMVGASEQYDALLATLNELFSAEDTRPIVIFQTDGDQLDSLKSGLHPDPYLPPRKYNLEDIMTAAEKARATVYSVISGVKFVNVPQGELARRARSDWENRRNATQELMRATNLAIKEPAKNPGDDLLKRHAELWLRCQTALVNLAQSSGALPEFLEEPGQADEIYTRILNDIDRRYVIGYYPTNRARDGKRRQVSIEVRGHPEYTVWGQKSYFAKEN